MGGSEKRIGSPLYTPGYYAIFFYDPDGIKLELLHRPTYWEWVGSDSQVIRSRA